MDKLTKFLKKRTKAEQKLLILTMKLIIAKNLTNLDVNENINQVLLKASILSLIPFSVINELINKKHKITVIHQRKYENDSFFGYPYCPGQLRLEYDQTSGVIEVREPSAVGTDDWTGQVKGYKISAETSDKIYFLQGNQTFNKRFKKTK